MQNTQNQNNILFDAVKNNVIPDGKTPQSWAQFFIAATAYVWMIGKEIKAIGEQFGEAIGNFKTAALSSYIAPDIVQIGFGLRCYAMGHQPLTACSAASSARPRCLTSQASSRMDS